MPQDNKNAPTRHQFGKQQAHRRAAGASSTPTMAKSQPSGRGAAGPTVAVIPINRHDCATCSNHQPPPPTPYSFLFFHPCLHVRKALKYTFGPRRTFLSDVHVSAPMARAKARVPGPSGTPVAQIKRLLA